MQAEENGGNQIRAKRKMNRAKAEREGPRFGEERLIFVLQCISLTLFIAARQLRKIAADAENAAHEPSFWGKRAGKREAWLSLQRLWST
ncbi:MAG TPA: hypothetical protein VHD63_19480 [Ktedonobacteraceae bacterium]|nr:hypothetical protein [Ktedonobacteraceae bacterium]